MRSILSLNPKDSQKRLRANLLSVCACECKRDRIQFEFSLKRRQGRKMHAKRAAGPRLFVMYSVGKHRPKKQNIILSGDRELLDARRNRLPTSVEPGSEHWQQTAI